MVLLTYQAETVIQESILRDKDSVSKNDSPKTAYIDKLCAFNEDYADEERCDLFFICQDGEIPAHRLVISNASKLIMAMQDDQPPWYPVYISVPDLTTEIVKTLVRLAYTGQMNIPPGTTSDELLDAMQTLGWVHTDCLTATYLDTSGANADDEFGASVSTKTAESLETVLKMNFPAPNKSEAETSDDDDGMEMALPDVPMSDEEEIKLEMAKDLLKKRDLATKGTRLTKQPKSPSPSKSKQASTSKRRQSPKPAKEKESPTPPETSSSSRKSSRKANEGNVNNNSATKEKQSDVTAITIENDAAEPVRSRTRTIRKPKKFDDLIVLTPTKRKDSPTKSPSKTAPKNIKTNDTEKEQTESTSTSKKSAATKKATRGGGDTNPEPVGSKSRRSTSSESKESPRNSLITSYFTKRNPRKSNDTTESEFLRDNENGTAAEVNNVKNAVDADDTNNETAGVEDGDSTDATNDSNTNYASLRKRARSTTSSKSDKDTSKDDPNVETETSSKTRRKRNQDSSELEPVEATPMKRGRKASTISNTSKSSTKEYATANDAEDKDTLRKTRSRQD